ncbi:hypothetical protein J7481_22810 [Labrenzia sp. R4_2]|nr:hypothetical protein [Labrenzia sp. R4_2]
MTLTSGLSHRQVAQDLGVGFYTQNHWIHQDRRDLEKTATQSELEKEISELLRNNRLLQEDRMC